MEIIIKSEKSRTKLPRSVVDVSYAICKLKTKRMTIITNYIIPRGLKQFMFEVTYYPVERTIGSTNMLNSDVIKLLNGVKISSGLKLKKNLYCDISFSLIPFKHPAIKI